MTEPIIFHGYLAALAVGAVLAGTAGAAGAQDAGTTGLPAGTAAAPAAGGSPYYLGASQALTHDSNVYRIPSGPGDTYSTTSLLAGFDQPIGRQRLFGQGSVSLNRYQDEHPLNNVGYELAAGLDWETLHSLSGSVNANLEQRLAAPAANVGAPQARRNLARQQGVSGVARWGGASLLILEGTLGYSSLDYSAPEYVSSQSKQEFGGLALYYRPSPRLRLGVAGRLDRTRTPRAFLQPDGSYESNQINGRRADLLVDYDLGATLSTNARIGYTRQTNSAAASGADFSGVTGNLTIMWRPTGKITVNAYAARDAGFNATRFAAASQANSPPTTTPIAGLYENNRVTNSLSLRGTYAATAKINVDGGLSYARARIVSTTTTPSGSVGSPDVIDESRGASLGVSYAIARPWLLGCNLSHDRREVSGAVAYEYEATSIGCSARFTWR